MRLLELKLTNFKGLQTYCFAPQGKNATLLGSNGTGKTTVFDALAWLLCGRGSDIDGKSFSPKPKDESGNELHGVDACAEGRFLLENGDTLTLGRTLREEWTARKGSSEKELTGNRTVCTIDGVPVTAGEYERRVAQLCPPLKAQILTAPLYFPTALHWQERRRLLLELCGEVREEEVLASSPALAELAKLLQKPNGGSYIVDEYRAQAAVRLKAVTERLRELPQRLDEVQRSLPTLPAKSEEELQREKDELSAQRDRLLSQPPEERQERNRLQLAAEETALERERAAFERQKNEELTACRQLAAALTAKRQAVQGKQLTAEVLLRGQQNELKRQRSESERLKKSVSETENSVFSGQGSCPTCGQALPPELILSAQRAFSAQKAQRLETLQAALAALEIDRLIKSSEEKAAELAALQTELAGLQAQEQALRTELSQLERRDFTATEAYAAHAEKCERLRADTPDTAKKELAALANALCGLEKLLTDYRISRERLARRAELNARQQQAREEFERLSRGIELCELFVRTKVSLLTERINAHFKSVRFRLFERQLNGGIRECCEVLVRTSRGLKLFADANAGARLCAGLELMDTFSEKWGISLPVFVDNAESVVQLPKIRSQLLRLQVSAADLVLRTELEEAEDGMD